MIGRRGWLAATLLPGAARAQGAAPWPAHPITLVSPLAAGTSVDIMARLLAQAWAPRLGQPVVVENRPAANGTLALEGVARAAPDGYTTVLTGQTSVAFNPHIYPSLHYDPLRDFAYITELAGVSNALVVRAGSPFHDLAGLLAAARASPGRLTYSSGGVGTTHHVSSAMLGQLAGVELTHVPYRGAPAGILAVQTGEVDFAFFNISTLLEGIRAGALRPLGVSSVVRSPLLPAVPTLRELGIAGYEVTTWFAVATVAGTPAPIVARLYAATRATLDDPAMARRLAELGFEPVPVLTPEEMLPMVRAEYERWGPVLRAAGARIE